MSRAGMTLDVHQIVQTGSDWVSAVRVMPPTPGSRRPARVAAASYDGTVYADEGAPLCAVGSAVLCLAPFRLHVPDPSCALGLPHAPATTRPASPLCASDSTSSAMSNGTSTTAGSDEAAAAAAAATTLSFVATGDSAGMLSVYLVGAEGGGASAASRLVAQLDCGKLSSLCCVSPAAAADDGDIDLVAAGGRCVHLVRFSASRRRQAPTRRSKPQEEEPSEAVAATPAPQHPCTPLVHCASFGGFAAPVVRPPATKRQRVDDGPASGGGGAAAAAAAAA
eukprot:Rhum_TRINITY_DN14934_c7_g2::Rhum_TRINITY_DN14934_c7_g2_i1::g.129336::m.129336